MPICPYMNGMQASIIAGSVGLAAPWIEASPLGVALSDGVSHRVADEVVRIITSLIRGV